MTTNLLVAIRATLATLLLTGIVYPLSVTGLAQLLFPSRANGSLVKDERGRTVGSELLGQRFAAPTYFHSRPSAAGEGGWDALASGGSNLGPTSRQLHDRAASEVGRLLAEGGGPGPVPADLVTSSGSGLDPDLSVEAVVFQIPRVAKARGVAPERLRVVVDGQIEPRELWVLGERRVNVLLLNLALDRWFGAGSSPGSP